MRIMLHTNAEQVTYRIELEAQDRPVRLGPNGVEKARLLAGDVQYQMPPGWSAAETHADLFAAVAVAIAAEFAGPACTFSFPISAPFSACLSQLYKCTFGPVDPALPPRRPRPGSRLALSFSAGVDSTAALLLAPKDASAVFLERIGMQGSSQYCPEAALRACRILRAYGRDVWTIGTDVELIRRPIGFVNDLTMSTPIILLADWLNLDATGYGLILESSYLDKGFRFREYAQTTHWKRFGGVAAAIGLPWHLLTAGLSEVVTTRLVLESPYQHVAQSCVRGPFAAPCLNCWKCFRKSLLEATLANAPLSTALLDKYFRIKEARHKLEQAPIKHEDVILWILQRYRGAHPEMRALQQLLAHTEEDLAWVERWFTPAREVLAPAYADATVARLGQFVAPMDAAQVARVRAWDRIAACARLGRSAVAH